MKCKKKSQKTALTRGIWKGEESGLYIGGVSEIHLAENGGELANGTGGGGGPLFRKVEAERREKIRRSRIGEGNAS